MDSSVIVNAPILLGLAVVLVRHLRGERKAARTRADEQKALFREVLEELILLRTALVARGAVEAPAKMPPASPKAPRPALPSVARQVVPVTRDEDPIHTRPTREAPPPAGEVRVVEDEPPSTKPSQSREVPAKSSPRPVSFDDQVRRAMSRLERQVKVPPEVEARWLERLGALGAELGLRPDTEPTDEQIEVMIRELYQAEADIKDARDAPPAPAPPSGVPPSAEATLPSTVAPIVVRIAAAARRGPDADGEASLRALPSANADDDPDEGRETGEDLTKVYSRAPGEADAAIPGVEVKPRPTSARPPHRPPLPIGSPLVDAKLERPTSSATRTAEEFPARRRPTLLGGLGGPRAPQSGDQEGGDGR